MNVGMLWFDKEKEGGVADKVSRAAEYYRRKYGKLPNVCYVNPRMMDEEKLQVDQVVVKSSLSIQPNYFWIGVRRNYRRKRSRAI